MELEKLDYSDKNTKAAIKNISEILDIIWIHYLDSGENDLLFKVPKTELAKNRTLSQAENLINGLKKEGCFGESSHMGTKNYSFEKTNHERFADYYAEIKQIVKNNNLEEEEQKENPTMDEVKATGELKSELVVGKLVAYNDGTIRYGKGILKMRNQLKDLCRLFMERPKMLITIDDIKDNIIHADKRGFISHSTIAKYVSELRKLLKVHFKKDVFLSQNGEGWTFSP